MDFFRYLLDLLFDFELTFFWEASSEAKNGCVSGIFNCLVSYLIVFPIIITFHLKVFKDEWQSLQKLFESLETTILRELFFK